MSFRNDLFRFEYIYLRVAPLEFVTAYSSCVHVKGIYLTLLSNCKEP